MKCQCIIVTLSKYEYIEYIVEIMCNLFLSQGLLGFYKGISASYMGISETVIHFVIYEAIKTHLVAKRMQRLGLDESLLDTAPRETRDFVEFMIAGAISKTIASSAAYPHGKS